MAFKTTDSTPSFRKNQVWKKNLLGVLLGNPVAQSISYHTHNKILEGWGRYEKYLLSKENFSEELLAIKKEKIDWLAVTMPFKEKILPYLDSIEQEAALIGAVNTIIVQEGRWIGCNTDGIGALDAIEEKISIQGKTVLILGAGGCGRAIAFEAKKRGAQVFLWNRTLEKALLVARALGVEVQENPEPCDILVNATSVGMAPNIEEMPILPSLVKQYQTVFDTVYTPNETKLLKEAQKQGSLPIYGIKMFAYLSYAQFQRVLGEVFEKEKLVSFLCAAGTDLA